MKTLIEILHEIVDDADYHGGLALVRTSLIEEARSVLNRIDPLGAHKSRPQRHERSYEASSILKFPARVVQPDGYIVAEGSREFCEGVLYALKAYTISDAYEVQSDD